MNNLKHSSFPSFEEPQEKTKIIKSANYTNTFCEKLFSMFEKDDLTDVCIIGSDEVRFNAHKNVLAVGSDFFAAMFASSLKESTSNEVRIQEVNGETLKPILDFLYTGIIGLQPKTVADILSAANFFQIKSLILECHQFMEEELDASNCLGIALFAEQHDLKKLYEKAFEFACMHFDQVSDMEEFLNLNEDQVIMMLSNDDLCVTSEKTVFFSLIKWIAHDKDNREKSTFKLFSHVQYWLLSPNFIKQNRNKLSNDPQIVEMICTWLEWYCSPDSSGLKSRKCCNDRFVAICRDKMHTYNPELNTWTMKTLPGFPSTFHKVVEIENNLIIQTDDDLVCYDLKRNHSTFLSCPDAQRTNYGLAVLKNELYFVGGYRNKTWIGLVQKFNFTSHEWKSVAAMSKPLTNPKIAVDGRYLHVKGDEEFMGSFDSECNNWTWTHFPFNNLSKYSFASINEKLFIVGEQPRSASSCVYERSNNGKWKIQEMRLALTSPKCISWNNRLIVCGRYDDLNLALEYDLESNRWKALAPLDQISNNPYEIININYKYK